MARPKLNTPKKKKLTLTVSAEIREVLTSLSEQRGVSISAMIEEWAMKEKEQG